MQIQLPNINGTTQQEQILQMRSYLYQFASELQWALDTLENGGMAPIAGSPMQNSPGAANVPASQKVPATFDEIKSLIIKSADIVTAYYEQIDALLKLNGEYVASSDFGTYRQETQALINASDEKIQALVTKTEEIDGDIEALRYSQSEIEQTAESITTRVTKAETDVVYAQETADAALDAAEEAEKDLSDLAVRVTTAETNIQQTSERIKLAATKSEVSTAKAEAISAAAADATTKADTAKDEAIADTAEKLKSYSTTEEMNAAIEMRADSIAMDVSKTYATQAEVSTVNAKVDSAQQTADAANARVTKEASSDSSMVQFTAIGNTGIYPVPYIAAYQSGSADPSPENVRPISGADALEVTLCAENLWRYGDAAFTQSKGFYLGQPLAPGTYIFGAFCTSTDTDSDTSGVRFMQGETILVTHQLARGRMQYVTVTLTDTVDRIVLYAANMYGTGAGDSATFTDIQLYDASDCKTETVRLPGTFYGGYVDWGKGQYVQTHQLLVLNGTESLGAFKDNGTTCEAYRYLVDKSQAYGICNMLSPVGYSEDAEGFGQHNNGLSFIVKLNKSRLASATVEGIQAWLAERYAEGTPVTFVYELKEPIVHDLGVLPALFARDGLNTVFHNGNGGLAVSYNHDGALLDRVNGVHQAALEGDSAVLAEFQEKNTQLLLDAEAITMAALEHYAKTSSLEELRRTLKAELEVWAGGISGRVSKTETDIQNVDGDLQEKFNQITKYFTFDINGMTIGQVDNPNKVVIDNDEISILVNGVAVQRFDADGNALIPSLSVTRKLNLLGLQAEADATHINFDIVG